jgi:hypothetical protein
MAKWPMKKINSTHNRATWKLLSAQAEIRTPDATTRGDPGEVKD